MDAILQKFAGKIDAQSVVKTVEEIRVEYIDDGLTKEDIPYPRSVDVGEFQVQEAPGPQKRSSLWVFLTISSSKLMMVRRIVNSRSFSKPWFHQW